MGTPERAYDFYCQYKDTIYGVVYGPDNTVEAESLATGLSMRVTKEWFRKAVESGEIDISKSREGFE